MTSGRLPFHTGDTRTAPLSADAKPAIDLGFRLYMVEFSRFGAKGGGSARRLKAACESLGYKQTPNLAPCRELLA